MVTKPVEPSIASLFATFEQSCLARWEPGWRREARIAFYCGFAASWSVMSDLDALSEAEAGVRLDRLRDEMAAYVAAVVAAAESGGEW